MTLKNVTLYLRPSKLYKKIPQDKNLIHLEHNEDFLSFSHYKIKNGNFSKLKNNKFNNTIEEFLEELEKLNFKTRLSFISCYYETLEILLECSNEFRQYYEEDEMFKLASYLLCEIKEITAIILKEEERENFKNKYYKEKLLNELEILEKIKQKELTYEELLKRK